MSIMQIPPEDGISEPKDDNNYPLCLRKKYSNWIHFTVPILPFSSECHLYEKYHMLTEISDKSRSNLKHMECELFLKSTI